MSATHLSNRMSLDIPDADMQAIQAALQVVHDKLAPHLVDLGAENRRLLPKMGAKTVDFVAKSLSHAQAHPELKPVFVDIDEFSRDLAAVGLLRPLHQALQQLSDLVGDTLLLAGSEAYGAALACYQSFKAAAKLNQLGAATIAADLAERFPGRHGKRVEPVLPGSAPGGTAASVS